MTLDLRLKKIEFFWQVSLHNNWNKSWRYKEILGFWISESESAKQWLNIFNEIKARGVEKIVLACCDSLKGISESLLAVFPEIKIQKCVIHQIRNSSKHVSPKDLPEFKKDMKDIYKSSSYKNALAASKNLKKVN